MRVMVGLPAVLAGYRGGRVTRQLWDLSKLHNGIARITSILVDCSDIFGNFLCASHELVCLTRVRAVIDVTFFRVSHFPSNLLGRGTMVATCSLVPDLLPD